MNSRLRVLFGLLLLITFLVQAQNSPSGSKPLALIETRALARVAPEEVAAGDAFVDLLQNDPILALETALEDHRRRIDDYTCTFVKQEMLPSGLTKEQTIAVKFRQEPYSVVMHWVRNPDKAERVIYVKDRWIDDESRQMAMCQPGPIARVFVRSLQQPIHGSLARKTSRRYIDEFGFANALDMLIRYSKLARERNELTLEFKGASTFDGRQTLVLERRLPYTGPDGPYPDRVAVVHIDREWRIPVSVACYADAEQTQLLGRYDYRDVRLDAGVTDAAFDPASYGM